MEEEIMRYALLLCAFGLLGGCVFDGGRHRDADPTVSYQYSTPRQYRSAAAEADAYCADKYGTRAQETSGGLGSGGKATFRCAR
jgi:hypothetical protein